MFKGIKTKVILGFGLAVLMVGAAGMLTFINLAKLTHTIEDVSKPDPVLEKVHEILSDLSSAEGSVKAYSLSRNEKYLDPYFRFVYTIEQNVDSLRQPLLISQQQLQNINTLDSLIDEKFDVFYELVDLKNSEKLQNSFGEIAQAMSTIPMPRRKNFREKVRALMGKNDESVTSANATGTKEMFDAVNKESIRQSELFSEKELALLQRDEQIIQQIRLVIEQIQKEEQSIAANRLEGAMNLAKDFSSTILWVSLFSMVLMLGLIYFIMADISRSLRYRDELVRSKQHSDKLAKIKEEFLANMSHEIRTPLNAIVGFTDQLLKTKVSPEQKKYMEAVHKSSEHLLRVVNEILDFSKIEAGKLRMEATGFRVKEVMDEIISTMRRTAENKNLRLNYNIDDSISETIFIGDPFRLKQVLLNLVGNGIKFTQKGKVEIHCSAVRLSDSESMVRFDVADTGIGIPKDKLETIFEEFTQADSRITRKFGGTGLGLAICRKLVELLGGKISVKSIENQGSVFSFTLRCCIGKVQDLTVRKPEIMIEQPPKSFQKKVLVVDDDEMNRLLVKTILNKYQVEIDEAFDGRQALEMVTGKNYDLILADIQMPEMSGIDLARFIRALPDSAKSQVPIIAITANVLKDDIEKYMEAGMNDHILKPFKEEMFCDKVFYLLNMDRNLVQKAGEQTVAKEREDLFSLAELKRVAGGDNLFVSKMVQTFIASAKSNMVNIKELSAKKDWINTGKIAHKMAPSCDNFKMRDLYILLKEIEWASTLNDAGTIIPELVKKAEALILPALVLLEDELEYIEMSN